MKYQPSRRCDFEGEGLPSKCDGSFGATMYTRDRVRRADAEASGTGTRNVSVEIAPLSMGTINRSDLCRRTIKAHVSPTFRTPMTTDDDLEANAHTFAKTPARSSNGSSSSIDPASAKWNIFGRFRKVVSAKRLEQIARGQPCACYYILGPHGEFVNLWRGIGTVGAQTKG